jgi:hypothetical protein
MLPQYVGPVKRKILHVVVDTLTPISRWTI